MVRNNLLIVIKSNFKEFLSILILIFLGTCFFVGMNSSSPVLKNTIDSYYDKLNFADIEVSSLIGFNNDEIDKISLLDGIDIVEKNIYVDNILKVNKVDKVIRIHSYSENELLNRLELIDGDLPKNEDEIVLDFKLQNYFKINDVIEVDNSVFNIKSLKVVGFVKSPLYLSSDKGSTNLLLGKINYYGYAYFKNFLSNNYNSLYIKVNKDINHVKNELIKNGVNITKERYDNLINDYTNKLATYKEEYSSKSSLVNEQISYYESKIRSAEIEISNLNSSIPTVEEANRIIDSKRNSLTKYQNELNNASNKINSSKAELNKAYSDLELFKNEVSKYSGIYSSSKNEFASLNDIYQARIYRFSNGETLSYMDGCNSISECQDSINQNNNYLNFLNGVISYNSSSLQSTERVLQNKKNQLQQAEVEYNVAKKNYDEALIYINSQSGEEIVNKLKKQVEDSNKKLTKEKENFENESKNAYDELSKIKSKIDSLEDYLSYVNNTDWKIILKDSSSFYSRYVDDINRVDSISNYFPVLFYLVAIFITFTNISKIVEKSRNDIGVFKALGYTNKQIISVYLLFSFIASFIGSLIGVFIGTMFIPNVFYKVYSLIYYLPSVSFVYDYNLIILSILLSVLIIVISSFFSCINVIKEKPVDLLQAKKLKNGKRIFLERISFFWSRLSFSDKLTYRNLFAYPKRIVLTVFGVSGCIALIVAALNLRYSISSIIPLQYGSLFKIDTQVVYKKSVLNDELELENERIKSLNEIDSSMLINLDNVTLFDNISSFLVVPEDNDLLLDFLSLKRKDKPIYLDDDGIIISNKLAHKLNISIGDNINLILNNIKINVKVSNICDNYIDNYIYMSRKYYKKILNINVKYNCLLLDYNGNVNERNLSKEINKNNNVSYLVFTSSAKDVYENINKSLKYIVYILVISSCILVIVVLFNLVTLNIEDRKREIATLKVLGLKKKEINKFVDGELIILINIGIIVGLVFGYIFSNILIKSCELDNLSYNYNINYLNYIISIVVTLFASYITFLFSRKYIKNINMVESLKK